MTIRQAATFIALLLTASIAGAQEKPAPVVKKVPIKQTSPTSGKEMFTQYCAVCHGADAKGGGPAAAALKTPPADLTTLAKRSEDGKFPRDRVANLLQKGAGLAAHGSSDMPIWGPLFKSLDPMHDIAVQQRIKNLNDYLLSIQAK
ncbi:MAG TPA: c-type cytochrome [Candidatus Acidoferrum sp.]|nr:c-type cytochrome [Candidatus Acidoferrum sp.]